MGAVGDDILESLNAATGSTKAIDAGIRELRTAVAAGNWSAVEPIRERLLAAVDGFVDNYCAAGRRLETARVRG